MRDPDVTLPAQYVRLVVEQLRGMGVAIEPWLRVAKLTEADLDKPSVTVPLSVLKQVVLGAIAVAREPALGLFVGERLVASTHGMVGYAAVNSGTIRQGLELLERFMPLRTSLLSVTHETVDDALRIRFVETDPLGAAAPPVLEAVMLAIKNVFDTMSMGTYQVRSASFPFEAPSYARLTRDFFGCDVRYGESWAGFTIPADVLDVPLKMADPEAFRQASRICQRELDKLAANTSLSARVRRLLLEKQSGFPSLQVTARSFHMTTRTLHRHLIDEGTSYREILEEVRHMLAVEHLKSGRFSVEEIAYLLGYSDLANFRRAFKRWESVSPSAYREKNAENPPKSQS